MLVEERADARRGRRSGGFEARQRRPPSRRCRPGLERCTDAILCRDAPAPLSDAPRRGARTSAPTARPVEPGEGAAQRRGHRAGARGGATRSQGIDVDRVDHERPAANARRPRRSSHRGPRRSPGPSSARFRAAASPRSRRTLLQARVRARVPRRHPERRRDSSAASRSASSSTACSPLLERIVADDGWHTALAVLHGGVNRAILSFALTGERMFTRSTSSRRQRASTCSTSERAASGSCARSTSRRTTSCTSSAPPDHHGALLGAVPLVRRTESQT